MAKRKMNSKNLMAQRGWMEHHNKVATYQGCSYQVRKKLLNPLDVPDTWANSQFQGTQKLIFVIQESS